MLLQIFQRKLKTYSLPRKFYLEFTHLCKSELLLYKNCLLTSLLELGYVFVFDLCLRIFHQASQGENITTLVTNYSHIPTGPMHTLSHKGNNFNTFNSKITAVVK